MNEISKIIIKKLKEIAKESSLNINELRIVTALERVVIRIESHPELSEHVIFKGGFVLFKVYNSSRFTRDIDAIGKNIDIEKIKKLIPVALEKNIDDGVWFGDVSIQEILDEDEYGGLRFNLAFHIGDPPENEAKIKNLSRVHFDIGIGDFVPDDLMRKQTELLTDKKDFLSWKVYPPEYIFSEKLQTLVKRKDAMSRAKDIYDLVWLFDCCDNKEDLFNAIENTFHNRETKIPSSWSKFINTLSSELIRRSWGSVQFIKDHITFEQAWGKLNKIFKIMDSYSSY
ncbi:MAG: hypothetical protein A2381_12275 [Bdellovibrionales bacterium RIFOXYB1_FULL_37_110]|nr:MAG: hypothetical protein A2181_01995 [Bdellovibrionales bacterium RIFOXYA1_FULL_38_20]OFZ52272.1 MAG: hypothetical protein A2417_06115 [Bdellovibrionales bacterium RIFOXYC1_FULL_37_79]OFZ57259.1 MAG: hypothetical protein A2381_12275 [Bdellovibrionales bacterium RIFOXYB1_FULL_37_110]OFZ65261.1 MAG: hypothetical protein A2577_04710 [Bdellovibrionales bacterium RIFOXYD1_FULL_36_51]